MVYEAMKRVMKKSLEYKHSVHIKNLYGNLKKDEIGTTSVEELCKRICEHYLNTEPEHWWKSSFVGSYMMRTINYDKLNEKTQQHGEKRRRR